MSDDEEISETELFVNNKGQPIQFSIKICEEKARLEELIKQGAGELTSKVTGPHTIRLIPEEENVVGSHGDSFRSKYIFDCVQQGRLLPLENYRAFKKSRFTDKISVMDIMMGIHSWDECERSGEKEEQIMGDFSIGDSSGNNNQHPERQKSKRNYTFKEQQAILDYIVKEKKYGEVKGISLWRHMEQIGVCPGRSHQSMKEHFIKKIIHNLNLFKLPVKVKTRLYRRFSSKNVQHSSRVEDETTSDESTDTEEPRTRQKCADTIEQTETRLNSSEDIFDISNENEDIRKVVDSEKQVEIKDQATKESQVIEKESLDYEWRNRHTAGPSGLSKQLLIERKRVDPETIGLINKQRGKENELVSSHTDKINPIVRTSRDSSAEQLTEEESELHSEHSCKGKLIQAEDNQRDVRRKGVQGRKDDKMIKCNTSINDNVEESHSREEHTLSFVQKRKSIDTTQGFYFEPSQDFQSSSGTKDNHIRNLLQAENPNTSLGAVPASEDSSSIQTSQKNACITNGMDKELIERNSVRRNIEVSSSTHKKPMVSVSMAAIAEMNQNTHNYHDTQETEMQSDFVCSKNITADDIQEIQSLFNDPPLNGNTDINITSEELVIAPCAKVVSLEPTLKSSCQEVLATGIAESEHDEMCSDSDDSTAIVPSSAKNSLSNVSYSALEELTEKHDDNSSKDSDVSTELFGLDDEKTDKMDLTKKRGSVSEQSESAESEVLIHRSVQTMTRKHYQMPRDSHKEAISLRSQTSFKQKPHCSKDEYGKSPKIDVYDCMSSSTPSDPASSIDSYSRRYDRTFNLKDGCVFGATRQRKSTSYLCAVKHSKNKEPYTIQEDLRIVRYIDRMRDYERVGGRELWQEMELREEFSNRSWHGLKERFRKRIFPRLHTYLQFGLSQDIVRRLQARIPFHPESTSKVNNNLSHRRPYSHKEEKLIVQFIVRTRRYSEVGAKAMWEIMSSTVPGLKGRTWLSLKERYRRHIINHLGVFNLTEEQIHNFRRPFERKKWKPQPKLHIKNRSVACTTARRIVSSSEDSYEGDTVDETGSDRSDSADSNTKQQLRHRRRRSEDSADETDSDDNSADGNTKQQLRHRRRKSKDSADETDSDDNSADGNTKQQLCHKRRKSEESDDEKSVHETDSNRSTTVTGNTIKRLRSDWKSSDDVSEKNSDHESDSDRRSAAAINKQQLQYKRKMSKGIENESVSSGRHSTRQQRRGKSRKRFKSSNNGQVKASTSDGRAHKQSFSPELEENFKGRKRSRITHSQLPQDIKKKLFQKRRLYNQYEMAKLSPKTPFNNVNRFRQYFQHKQEGHNTIHTNLDEKQEKNTKINNQAEGESSSKKKHGKQKKIKNKNENNEEMPWVEAETVPEEQNASTQEPETVPEEQNASTQHSNSRPGGHSNTKKKSDKTCHERNDVVGGGSKQVESSTVNVGGSVNGGMNDTVSDEVSGTVNDEVDDTVNDEVGGTEIDEVGGTVNDEVGETVNDEVSGTVNDEVSGTVNDEVGGTVNDEVSGTVNDEVSGTVNDEVGGTVNDEVGGTEIDEVGGTVNDEVSDTVNDEMGGTERDKVGDTVNDEVGDTVNDEVGDTVNDEVGGTVNDEVGDTVNDEVGDTVNDEVGGTVNDEVGDTVNDEVGDTVNDEVGGTVNDEMGGTERDKVGDTVYDEVGDTVNNEVGGTERDKVGGTERDKMGGTERDKVGDTVNDEVGDTVNNEVGGTEKDKVGGTVNEVHGKSIITSKHSEPSTVNVADTLGRNLSGSECSTSPRGNIISKNKSDESLSHLNLTPASDAHKIMPLDRGVQMKNKHSILNRGNMSLSDITVKGERNSQIMKKSTNSEIKSSKMRHRLVSPNRRITRQSSDSCIRRKLRKMVIHRKSQVFGKQK
ncbi:myb-like protein X isoform X2 [Procambarus clarkii]|uniref:myb-like protein X isoform X2 n=1 Tax=Procambarus clarkii TaxID=6728 RepID=UPI003742965F